MLRLRLIFGLSLAGAIIALLSLDGYLSELPAPDWDAVAGVNVGRWVYNGALCTLVVAVLVSMAARELVRFIQSVGFRPSGLLTLAGVLILVVGPYVVFNAPESWAQPGEASGLLVLSALLAAAFLYQAVEHGTQKVMVNIGATLFIVLYVGGLGQFLVRLRMEVGESEGVTLLLYSMAVVKITDVGAYFTGSLIGRHKLIPWLSPKKTWEGLLGGIIAAALAALGIGYALHASGLVYMVPRGMPYVVSLLVFGLLMAVLSVAGDLCASLLKRDAAVKDSGETLPGFGGVLDVLDSPLLAAPMAWLFWTRIMPLEVT